jgi:microcompartment protein CcmK/EutM
MELARVTGTVTATVKDESLSGRKLLTIVRVDSVGDDLGAVEVAVDAQGAGVGDTVLLVRGSGARQVGAVRSAATDLTIVAIVDRVDVAEQATTTNPTPSRRKRA